MIKILNIAYPIIQAPMAGGFTTPELVAAVSNAGGLGSLGAGYMPASEIKKAIQEIRGLTDKPFAVNLFIPKAHYASTEKITKACHDIEESCSELAVKIKPVSPPYSPLFEEQMKVIIAEKIPVFSFTFGLLDSAWIKKLKVNNTIIIGTATNLSEGLLLQESGADMIVAQGSEAGGHRGTFAVNMEEGLIHLPNLVSQLSEKIKISIIAAGGIMNGNDIAKMLSLGAASVQMGTAFLTCTESGAHPSFKKLLLSMKRDETILTRAFSGAYARGIKNKFTEHMELKKENILDYPIQNALTNQMRKVAKEKNDTDFMSLWAGQSAQLCRDVSAVELIQGLVFEMNDKR
ncbi:MAG: nitronate monooxygenase [Gammaproteobacteria bacterium]|nr:nitronate monooxygenase [Gammaproteobacteria bacterium]